MSHRRRLTLLSNQSQLLIPTWSTECDSYHKKERERERERWKIGERRKRDKTRQPAAGKLRDEEKKK
jgi:hypothetical protein